MHVWKILNVSVYQMDTMSEMCDAVLVLPPVTNVAFIKFKLIASTFTLIFVLDIVSLLRQNLSIPLN